jgi:hypothetical protein
MKPTHALAAALLASLLVTLPQGAAAMGWPPSPDALMDLATDSTQSLMIRRVLKDAQVAQPDAPAPSAAVAAMRITLAPTSPSAEVARRLAAHYPAAQRAQAQQVFEQLLQSFRSIETRFGIPHNDVAGALAGLLAGSLMAWQGSDFPDRHFKPLVAQMRAALRQDAQFTASSPADKRALYEELAILGMFISAQHMGLAQQPDAALRQRLREVAHRHIVHWLQVEPDRVQITARGLAVR